METQEDAVTKFGINTENLVSYIITHVRKLNENGKTNISELVLMSLTVVVKNYDKKALIDHFIRLTWRPNDYVKDEKCSKIAEGVLWNKIFDQDEEFMKEWSPIILENLLVSKQEQFSTFTSTIPGMKFDAEKIKSDVKKIFIDHMDTPEIKNTVWTYIRYMLISSIKYIWYCRDPVMVKQDDKLVQMITKPTEYEGVKIVKYINDREIKVRSRVLES